MCCTHIGIKAEDAAYSLHDMEQIAPVRQVRTQPKLTRTALANLNHPEIAATNKSASIHTSFDTLDPADRTLPQVP